MARHIESDRRARPVGTVRPRAIVTLSIRRERPFGTGKQGEGDRTILQELAQFLVQQQMKSCESSAPRSSSIFSPYSRLSGVCERREGMVTCSMRAASRSTEELRRRRFRGSTPKLREKMADARYLQIAFGQNGARLAGSLHQSDTPPACGRTRSSTPAASGASSHE